MSDAESKPGGWLAALQRSGDSLLGLAQTRVEIFAVEFQEERRRTLGLLVWLGVALMLGGAGLLLGMGALALFLWDIAGFAGIVGLALVALGGAAAVFWRVRREIQNNPPPFGDTIAEFRKDRECLRPRE